jgi:osmoprotectant transport system ATP-binding protein
VSPEPEATATGQPAEGAGAPVSGEAAIELIDVSKSYDQGETWAVREVNLRIESGETLVLLGSSGCGKTTTMRMINRLIEPTEGEIRINGRDTREFNLIQLRREIGYAIQHIGLFPHMTVGENIAVVPQLLGWSKSDVADRVNYLLSMVGLAPDEFRDRFPNQLSGGQSQRIGVARALAADPPIVLMDEPFGALDPITREQLQNEFLELESEIQKTVVFVTHDVFEAVKMGDRIALLDEGRMQQLAEPAQLVDQPANEFVDQFLGQHRFQLALLTRTVRSILDEVTADGPPPENPEIKLRARSSLVEALDLLKRTGRNEAPIYDRGEYRGTVRKKQLLSIVARVLGEAGESA